MKPDRSYFIGLKSFILTTLPSSTNLGALYSTHEPAGTTQQVRVNSDDDGAE